MGYSTIILFVTCLAVTLHAAQSVCIYNGTEYETGAMITKAHCVSSECVNFGTGFEWIDAMPFCLIECADSEGPFEYHECCPHCPNGLNCYAPNNEDIIIPFNETLPVTGYGLCTCVVPPFDVSCSQSP